MDDISQQIHNRLDGHGHADWCGGSSTCDCRPGAEPSELAGAIRDVLDLCDDLEAGGLAGIAESIRLTVAVRLRIVDASGVNRRLAALAIQRLRSAT